MPGFTNDAKNTMLAALVGLATPTNTVTHISLHTADPGSNGASEVTGGDPAYARVAVDDTDWKAAANGEVRTAADIPFNGPANGDATHMGIWDATTFLGGGAITGDTTFNAEGNFILQEDTRLDLNAA